MFLPFFACITCGTTKSRSKWEVLVLGETKVPLDAGQHCVLWRSPGFLESACGFVSLYDSFNVWEGRGCRKFVPGLKGDGTKIAPPGDIFDQPSGEMS